MLSQLNKKDKRNYLLLLVGTVFHFGSISYMYLLPRFIKHIGGNENHIGFIFGIAIIPSLLISPLGGYLSDKMSGKKLVITGSAVTIFSTLSFIFVTDISPLIYILRILQGSGHALYFAVVFSILSHIIPETNRAEGIAYFAVCAQTGNSLGSFLAEQIINNLGYNYYFIGSFSMGVITIAMLCLITISNHERDAAVRAETAQKISVKNDGYFSAIFRKNYVSGFLLILFLGGGYGTVVQFVTPYLDYLYRASLSTKQIPASLFIPPALITVAISRLLLSKITDRLGRKKIIFVNFPLFILTIFLITIIRSEYVALIIAILFGLSYGFLFPALNAVILSRAEVRHRGKIAGILVMLFDSSFYGFAFIMGPLAYRAGYFSMFYVLAAIMLAGLLFYIILEKVKHSPATNSY